MTVTRSLGAAQTTPTRGDVDANIDQHLRLARAAAAESVELLVFPELSLTGYELDLAGDLAFSERDPRLGPLIDLASSSDMTLVVGAPVRLDARLHIGAFIITPDRAIDLYTKHHLGAFPVTAGRDGVVPPAEATVFHPGTRAPLVRVAGRRAAVAVCADTSRPSHVARAVTRGASFYLASTFVIPSDLEADSERLQAYAVRHSLVVLFANFGGPSGGLASGGRSTIWSERGDVLARLERSGAGLAVADEDEAGWHGRTVVLRND